MTSRMDRQDGRVAARRICWSSGFTCRLVLPQRWLWIFWVSPPAFLRKGEITHDFRGVVSSVPQKRRNNPGWLGQLGQISGNIPYCQSCL
ncbi:hypothetical protein NDU88_001196 [Pleurodeles waltl]|uniref:Uncharacterized protein n=1 Tax=Pleurodeles waltl TaxID=8319 RepID=A0AAV7R7W1_PLEWA|nr:hypothetical protein NDU88_001196 [Pleurodeles waltl]